MKMTIEEAMGKSGYVVEHWGGDFGWIIADNHADPDPEDPMYRLYACGFADEQEAQREAILLALARVSNVRLLPHRGRAERRIEKLKV